MRRLRAARSRGLTLVELLVTLVIAALVATLAGQALFQLARIERLLEGGQVRSMVDSVRAEWVRSAIEALLPGEPGSAERLVGGERELQGLSADVPMLPAPGLAALRLRLVRVDAEGVTQLQQLPPSPGGLRAEDKPVVLLSWAGATGRFRYLDARGEWLDRWPPPQGAPTDALPRAIAIETGLDRIGWLVAPTRASAIPLPTRRRMEAM